MALGPDPGRPQLGDDLSVKPRASELAWPVVRESGLAWGWGAWIFLVWIWIRDSPPGRDYGEWIDRRAGTTQAPRGQVDTDRGHHGIRR